jgi:thioredoxin
MKIFNDDNFLEDVIKESEKKPVLVDFYAEWCGPCKFLKNILNRIVGYSIGGLDVDKNPEVTDAHKIQTLPTLILFRNGEAKETLHGLQPEDVIIELLKKYE